MKKPIWILVVVAVLVAVVFSIAMFNRKHQERSRSGSQTSKPAPYRIRTLDIQSTRPVTPELLASLDPMTGVIAGHVEGTYPIWDLAVSHVDMRPGYYSLTPMPITYEERRFCAKRLPAGTYCITKPGGYANQTVRLGPGEIVDDIIFSRNDVKVRLRIEGFSGRVPIGSRISVKLTTLYDSDSSYSIVKSVVIPEDRALSFRMPRGHDLQLTVRTPQSGGLLMYRVPFSAAVGDVLDIPLTLDNWPKIAGKVVDAAGEMVSGVTISLLETLDPVRRDRSSYATNELMQVCSGKNGLFTINVPPDCLAKLGFTGDLHNYVEVDRIEPGRAPITVNIGELWGELLIQTNHASDGRPVGRIALKLQREGSGDPVQTETNSNGTAILRTLEPGRYSIHSPNGFKFTPSQVTVDAGGLTKLNLAYEGPALITFEATETKPGRPGVHITQGHFEMLDESEPLARAAILGGGGGGHAEPDGTFSIETPRKRGGFAGIVYPINATLIAPGYEIDQGWTSNKQHTELTDGTLCKDMNLVLGLRQAPLVSGRIISPTGQPLSGARVLAMPCTDGVFKANRGTVAISGQDGEFTLTAHTETLAVTGAAHESMITVRHPLYATCIYSASGFVPGTISDLGDVSVLPARQIRVKITYENPEQKRYWPTRSTERYEVQVQQGEHLQNRVLGFDSERVTGDALFPARPFTSVRLQLQHPASTAFYSSWFSHFDTRREQPWECARREELPDTVELIAPALPIRRFRIVDKDGEPVRNAFHKVTLIQDRLGFWERLLPGKLRRPRYGAVKTYHDLHTTFAGRAEFIITENFPMVVVVIPMQQGPTPLPISVFQETYNKLPKNSFVPRSEEDIGDLVLSATVAPGVWAAMPK